MKKPSSLKVACMVAVFCAATAMLSLAQDTFTTLVNFDITNGSVPYMVLTQGVDGNFYGTTWLGGVNNRGTVFKMTPAGTLTTLYNFCSQTNCVDGGDPLGSLVQAVDGDFYGTTEDGGAHGSGTVYKITSKGKLTTIYSFCSQNNCADGEEPFAGLVPGKNGDFYGTTGLGGIEGAGTVFKITPRGELTTLYTFCTVGDCTDGYGPRSPLVRATNGNFYGETVEGGSDGFGTIFEITPEGKLTTVFSFDGNDGSAPNGGLIQAANGNFYGITFSGGSGKYCDINGGCGTVFRVTPRGGLTTLYNFCSQSSCTDAAEPNGPLVQGIDGNFYGTTYGDNDGGQFFTEGTTFEITPGGVLTTLYSFCSLPNCADGVLPLAGLLQATNGAFYGTTSEGGTDNQGTVFSLLTGLGPFVKTQPTFANEGVTIGIFGQGFTRSSVVQFDGVQATNVKFFGAPFLEVKVPTGALTGSVTVTTNGTTLTSNQVFRVSPQVLSFSPPSGSVGTQVTITGTGFTQAMGVGFGDHVPAQFTVNSDTQITATVPGGAKTGPVGVLTKGGTGISSKTFTVN